MKLLTEELPQSVKMLEESNGDKKKFYIEGIFAQSEVVNRNKRRYPEEVLTNEINRYLKENVQMNSAWGEMNHPSGPNINGDRICLRIVDLKKEGTDFHGKALLTGPYGPVVRGLIEDGGRLGVSTRALGSVKPLAEGINEVQKDLRLLAVDCVTDPSAPNAYVNGILENKEWIYNPALGIFVEQVVETHKEIIETKPAEFVIENELALFESFCRALVYAPKVEKPVEKPVIDEYTARFLRK